MDNKTIFEKSAADRKTDYIASTTVLKDPSQHINKDLLRQNLDLPSLGELDVVRHYSRLAQKNLSVDTHFYPLGSCTMKYNPKINEVAANFDGFSLIHPYQDQETVSGALELIFNLEQILCRITGMSRFTFQPASGAQGEFAGMQMIRKYHQIKGNKKTKVIVPDSSHGTNPATAAMCGYKIVVVESGADGLVDIEKLKAVMDNEVAGIMLTNPNTLGLFEEHILEIAKIIHDRDGLLYYDGANFNALMGMVKPSLMGFDVIHLNLHKSFSTPHGCGGPGSGAVGVNEKLVDFLPVPVVEKRDKQFVLNYDLKNSIGQVRGFYGNFSVLVRAYAYLLRLGADGIARVCANAVLNANYIKQRLKDVYLPSHPDKTCMHEVVFSCVRQKEQGVSALNIAKRLIDFGVHPPTMYFPLIVKEALMVEPTETESKDTLDRFIESMLAIAKEIQTNPEIVKTAPHTTPVKLVDDVKAARFPDLRFKI